MSELQYHNIHLSANLKILAFAAYFATMPIILTVDFFIVQCLSTKMKAYKWFNENIAQSFFFSGPLMLFTVMSFPVLLNLVLEIKFLNVDNEFQIYSVAVCAGLALILILYLAALWTVIITHYKHKNHPMVLTRFGFLLNHIKDGAKDGEKPTLTGSLYIPLMVTKRMFAALTMAVLIKYTVSPALILGSL